MDNSDDFVLVGGDRNPTFSGIPPAAARTSPTGMPISMPLRHGQPPNHHHQPNPESLQHLYSTAYHSNPRIHGYQHPPPPPPAPQPTSCSSSISASTEFHQFPGHPGAPHSQYPHPPFTAHPPRCGRPGQPSSVSSAYASTTSAPFTNTPQHLHQVIKDLHPHAAIIATDSWNIDLLTFSSENGTCVPNTSEGSNPFVQWEYIPSNRRLLDPVGSLAGKVTWGRYDLTYRGEEFIVYVTQFHQEFSTTKLQFALHYPPPSDGAVGLDRSEAKVKTLLLNAAAWGQSLRSEIWVFDMGYWQKDGALFDAMAKASWDDVILPKSLKEGLRKDVVGFFGNRATYQGLGVAWKRGIIMHGPPGNGKTISLKALMNELYFNPPPYITQRPLGSGVAGTVGGGAGGGTGVEPIPALYVRSFQSWGGDQMGINSIFQKARSVAPCLLILEDIDSLITPGNRSYFLNEMDGLDDNNGVFVIATTNHLDQLDKGIVGRPSRFDRKYEYGLPGVGGGEDGGRKEYVEYWRKKLRGRQGVVFTDELAEKVVERTEGFSFAYLKEAFVSTLLLIAAGETGGEDDKAGVFERVLLNQIDELRKQIGGNADQ